MLLMHCQRSSFGQAQPKTGLETLLQVLDISLNNPKAVADTGKAAKGISHMTSEASIMSVESDDDVNDLTGK